MACDMPADYVVDATDCDDTDPATSPAAAEVCDGIDNDCDVDSDEDGVCDAPLACGDEYGTLGSDTGPSVTGSWGATTESTEDSFSGSCGEGGGPDIAFTWTAPDSGTYVIDTHGSGFDTVLRIYDTDCETELECDDDTPGSRKTSEVTRYFDAGETIIIVVDGYAPGRFGGYVINITVLEPEPEP